MNIYQRSSTNRMFKMKIISCHSAHIYHWN